MADDVVDVLLDTGPVDLAIGGERGDEGHKHLAERILFRYHGLQATGRVGIRADRECSESEPPELLRIALPVFGDLDTQAEEDLLADQGFDLLAGGGAHRAEP